MQKNCNNKKILIADSCSGGVSILPYFLSWCGNYDIIYLADGEYNPFGLKPVDKVYSIVEDWLLYCKKIKAQMLIIACNTASISIGDNIEQLSSKYGIPIVTMIDAMKISFSQNVECLVNKNVVLFGTKLTVGSNIYQQLLRQYKLNRLHLLPGTETEAMIARGGLRESAYILAANTEISRYVCDSIDTFILACTCFEFAKDKIADLYGNQIKFVSPNSYVSEIVKSKLHHKVDVEASLSNIDFITTGRLEEWNKNVNIIINLLFNKTVDVRYQKIR